MTPLRKKMIRELELQRKAPGTVKIYVAAVADLARHYGRSPDRISIEQVRDYFHHVIAVRKLAFSTCNQKLAGIRFFYQQVLGRADFNLRVAAKRSGRLPEPISREEVARLLAAAKFPKHHALLATAYGTGLRLSELVHLRPEDIHSERMLIRVNLGKGHKDRYTLLSKQLLKELRAYWRHDRPGTWLFAKQDHSGPMPVKTAQEIYYTAKKRSGITHGHGIHTLRHSFASHLLESGIDLLILQRLLGHTNLATTSTYLHVTEKRLSSVESPLDLLRLPKASER